MNNQRPQGKQASGCTVLMAIFMVLVPIAFAASCLTGSGF